MISASQALSLAAGAHSTVTLAEPAARDSGHLIALSAARALSVSVLLLLLARAGNPESTSSVTNAGSDA
jgi:hypothetical protein